jgi:hypothetical protein
MPFTCAFCGSTKRPRGREHVFPDWLNSIGLEAVQVEIHTGRLNRVARRWTTEGFTATVRAVCDDCNHGWLSQLEGAAKPVLARLVLGQLTELSADDQRQVAAWTYKTALVAMLSSSDEQRALGYGVPEGEYHALYATREDPEPLPHSQCWIGTYVGDRPPGSVRVVPVGIELDGVPAPDGPDAYTLTVMVGPMLVHGVQFTTPSLYVELATVPDLPRIWPAGEPVSWPTAVETDDPAFEQMASGKALRVLHPGIRLEPFKPATDLPPSTPDGPMLRQPVPCAEQHIIYFPGALALEAMRYGKRYAFVTMCECPVAYLVVLEKDGAHFRNDGTLEAMAEVIDRLEGPEYELSDENGIFVYKELAADH